MKGLLVVLTGFVFLPGSVYMLLASNFGALKGYLIAVSYTHLTLPTNREV